MLQSITEMVSNNLQSIELLEREVKKYADMLEGILDSDSTYQLHTEQAKEANRIKSGTRQNIMKQPQAASLNTKLKDMKQQLKEAKNGLSDYLQEYRRLSGSDHFEDAQGNTLQIVFVAKLVRG